MTCVKYTLGYISPSVSSSSCLMTKYGDIGDGVVVVLRSFQEQRYLSPQFLQEPRLLLNLPHEWSPGETHYCLKELRGVSRSLEILAKRPEIRVLFDEPGYSLDMLGKQAVEMFQVVSRLIHIAHQNQS